MIFILYLYIGYVIVILGITCRDYPTFYPHFLEEGLEIIQKLQNFFEDFVHLKFPRKHCRYAEM